MTNYPYNCLFTTETNLIIIIIIIINSRFNVPPITRMMMHYTVQFNSVILETATVSSKIWYMIGRLYKPGCSKTDDDKHRTYPFPVVVVICPLILNHWRWSTVDNETTPRQIGGISAAEMKCSAMMKSGTAWFQWIWFPFSLSVYATHRQNEQKFNLPMKTSSDLR